MTLVPQLMRENYQPPLGARNARKFTHTPLRNVTKFKTPPSPLSVKNMRNNHPLWGYGVSDGQDRFLPNRDVWPRCDQEVTTLIDLEGGCKKT